MAKTSLSLDRSEMLREAAVKESMVDMLAARLQDQPWQTLLANVDVPANRGILKRMTEDSLIDVQMFDG